MGYSSGADVLPNIIDAIANGLIATPGGYWTDGDTSWNTSVRTGNSARRCLMYTNGSETIYLALESINSQINYFYYSAWYYMKGIRVVFSATWDSIGHTYPSTNQSMLVPIEVNGSNGSVGADMASLSLTYYLWIESNGFVLMGKPAPHADTQQQSFFVVVERNPTKEYSDGYTNFYAMNVTNYWPSGYYDGTNQGTSLNRQRGILRPFAYQYPDGTGVVNYGISGNGISFVPTPSYYAFKSSGNGKAYYVQPIVHNLANQLAPIFQSQLWFPWSETVGLIDGDVIAVEGQTTKFLCKALDSPDSTNRLDFAIKYVA